MATGTLTADGSTKPFITKGSGTHLALDGSFGGGTVAVQKHTVSGWVSLYNEGTAETFAADDDVLYNTGQGLKLRLTLSGATSPSLDWMLESRG